MICYIKLYHLLATNTYFTTWLCITEQDIVHDRALNRLCALVLLILSDL